MERFHAARLRSTRQRDVVVLDLGRNVARQFPVQFPLRTFDRDGAIGADVYLYLCWKGDCLISDSRHTTTKRRRAVPRPHFVSSLPAPTALRARWREL